MTAVQSIFIYTSCSVGLAWLCLQVFVLMNVLSVCVTESEREEDGENWIPAVLNKKTEAFLSVQFYYWSVSSCVALCCHLSCCFAYQSTEYVCWAKGTVILVCIFVITRCCRALENVYLQHSKKSGTTAAEAGTFSFVNFFQDNRVVHNALQKQMSCPHWRKPAMTGLVFFSEWMCINAHTCQQVTQKNAHKCTHSHTTPGMKECLCCSRWMFYVNVKRWGRDVISTKCLLQVFSVFKFRSSCMETHTPFNSLYVPVLFTSDATVSRKYWLCTVL